MYPSSKNRVVVGAALAVASGFLAVFGSPAQAVTTFGSLSNFDAINDTGQTCRGFEIELEGIHPADIYFTFGNPYIRYGDPVKIDTGTGTIIRYSSPYVAGVWSVGTPTQDPMHPITTGGHQLFFQGDPNYINEPGDHFGVALNGNPTNTVYRWLFGDSLGNLTPAGTNLKIPAPIFTVAPPVANPVAPAAVQAVAPAPPKDNPGDLFGEAIWAKVFVTESNNPVALNQLVVGNAIVPDGSDVAEVEIEWQLLQAGKGGGLDELDSGLNDLGVNAKSVVRRYEYYAYTGAYDSEGEALFEDPTAADALAYNNGLGVVGNFIGAQNAAVNLEAFVPGPGPGGVPEPATGATLVIALAGIAGQALNRRHASR